MRTNQLKDITHKDICPYCGQRMTKLIRLASDGKTPTHNETYICENPKCIMYFDYKKIRNWKREDLIVYPENEQPKPYNPREEVFTQRYQKQVEKHQRKPTPLDGLIKITKEMKLIEKQLKGRQ